MTNVSASPLLSRTVGFPEPVAGVGDFGHTQHLPRWPPLVRGGILGGHQGVYEAGAIDRPDKIQAGGIDPKVVAKECKKYFEISRISRFRYRTRCFMDSGIIGSKEFVTANYQRFKHVFHSKHEKKPKPIKGLEGGVFVETTV